MRAIVVLLAVILGGCSSNTPKEVIDALAFKPGQCGHTKLNGTIDLGCRFGIACSKTVVDHEKRQPCPPQEPAGEN